MTVVKELFTRMGFQVDFNKLNQFDKGLAGANRAVDNLKRNVGQRLKLQIDAMGAESASGKIKSLIGDLKGLAAAYIGFQGISKAASFIAETGMEFEKLSASLETVEGNSAKAATAFKKIEKFAAKTPYDLNQVTEAYIKLKSLGLEPSERALTAYGNTAGAMGKPLMQMIEAVADASTGEFERLKEFGIKTKKQGENVTFTFKGVQTTVKNNSENIQKYLLKIGEVDFAGGMDRQSKTIGGKISTLKDNFGALAREIWKGGLGQAAHQFVKWLSETTAKLQPFMKEMAQKLPHALQTLKKWLPIVAGGLFLMTFRMIGLKAIMVGGWILNAIKAMRGLTFAAGLANLATMAIPIAIGAVVAAVAYLGYEIYKFATTGKGWIADLGKQWPEFGALANQARELFLQWMPTIMEVFEVIKILVMDGIIWLGQKTIEVIQYWILPAIVAMAEIWKQFWAGFVIIRDGIIQAYEDWKTGITIVGDAWKTWQQNVTNTVNLVKETFMGFFDYLAEKFKWVTDIAGNISGSFKKMSESLGGFGFGGGGGGDGYSNGPAPKNERQLLKSVYPTMVFLGRGAHDRGDAGHTPHGYEARDAGVGMNSPVKAAAAGRVTFAGWMGGYGNAVIVSHGNGLTTLYAHNTSFAQKVGSVVKKGSLLALSGTTGNSSGPHGHFEIRKNNVPVPIAQYMNQLYGQSNNGLASTQRQPEKTVQMPAASVSNSPISNMMNAGITQNISLSVGGSNSPASEIARQTGAVVKTQTKNALATVGRSVPQKVAPR